MDGLTRERLAGRPRRRLNAGRNLTKGVVDRVEAEGGPIVLKDVAARPWPVRRLLGPWQLDREAAAYRRLQGIPGIPRLLGRPDPQAIVLEFVPGRTLAAVPSGDLDESFFDRLDGLIQAMHERGVAHGDLSRRDVLDGPGGRPHLVDFSTALVLGPDPGRLRRFLFAQMCQADRRAAARLRGRLVPGSRGAPPPRPVLFRLGSALKRVFDLLRRRRPRR